MTTFDWSIGMTTFPCQGRWSVAAHTRKRLCEVGFPSIVIGINGTAPNWNVALAADQVCYHVVEAGAFGNWHSTAWQIYHRNPYANRYAIFQDDILVSGHLRQYLETVPMPVDGYLNLITYPRNAQPSPEECSASAYSPWYHARMEGHGAQGLIFSNESFRRLLICKPMLDHMRIKTIDGVNQRDGIDGVVRTCMDSLGIREYVHPHSLISHVNSVSTLDHPPQPESYGFLGEGFDLMELQA